MNKNKSKAAYIISALCLSLSACSGATKTVSESEELSKADAETETEYEEIQEENISRGTGEIFSASEDDTHALTVDGENAEYDNIKVEKSGDSKENDESDFYGTNAAVFVTNKAELSIKNSYIKTDGGHANAVFSYGEGTTINISDTTIETSKNNSGGIMVTGGGTINAENLDISTKGGSSAAIRSDRGGGTINVNGGSYESYGKGSPAIYSTADIYVSDAELYSDVSQAVVIEGKNSVTLTNTNATGKNTEQNSDNSTRSQAVMIYQSMSGDAGEGKGTFTMIGGSLTSLYEGMFFVTNTEAEINLENVSLNYASDDLLRIEAAGWGNDGSNGGYVLVNAEDQSLEGKISVDEISALNLKMSGESVFEGAVENSGKTYVELDDNAVWKLTGDSFVSGLTCSEKAVKLNGYKLLVDGNEYEEGNASEGAEIDLDELKKSRSGKNQEFDKNGAPPEKPDGEGGRPPQKPEGEDSAPPEKPEGEGGRPPEKPEGEDGTPPEKPEGEGDRPPEKPDGENETPPEKP